jgi:cytochrome P450
LQRQLLDDQKKTNRQKCLGLHLARMELRAALEALHRRIPDYTLDGELEYTGMPRSPSKLPLRWR